MLLTWLDLFLFEHRCLGGFLSSASVKYSEEGTPVSPVAGNQIDWPYQFTPQEKTAGLRGDNTRSRVPVNSQKRHTKKALVSEKAS